MRQARSERGGKQVPEDTVARVDQTKLFPDFPGVRAKGPRFEVGGADARGTWNLRVTTSHRCRERGGELAEVRRPSPPPLAPLGQLCPCCRHHRENCGLLVKGETSGSGFTGPSGRHRSPRASARHLPASRSQAGLERPRPGPPSPPGLRRQARVRCVRTFLQRAKCPNVGRPCLLKRRHSLVSPQIHVHTEPQRVTSPGNGVSAGVIG